MYIANSSAIVKLIIQLYMSDHYPSIKADRDFHNKIIQSMKVSEERRSQKTQKQLERIFKVHDIIKDYKNTSARAKNHDQKMQDKTSQEEIVITAKDIVLNPYVYSPDYKDHFEEQS